MNAELERAAPAGLRGVKVEIAHNARAACMAPVMRAARTSRFAVLQHTWAQTNIRQRRHHSDPTDTAQLAPRFSNVRIMLAR